MNTSPALLSAARTHFRQVITQDTGDLEMAQQRYKEFLERWKNADPDRPEVAIANAFLAKAPLASKGKP